MYVAKNSELIEKNKGHLRIQSITIIINQILLENSGRFLKFFMPQCYFTTKQNLNIFIYKWKMSDSEMSK